MTGTVFLANPGEAYHLWCHVCAERKYKFFVVAYGDDRLRFFLINSNPAAFQRDNPELMSHQVPLLASQHGFLTHDSFLDCSQILGGYTTADLATKFGEDRRVYLGQIAEAPRQQVRVVVEQSRVLTRRDKESVLACW